MRDAGDAAARAGDFGHGAAAGRIQHRPQRRRGGRLALMHVHMHAIPRYRGDRPDPRGGIRWTVPEKADYWIGRCK